ncbi:hypothetical protein ACKKBF_B36705 [Auxenochlorella protothecoides x Auxenochlorella symbiontica]
MGGSDRATSLRARVQADPYDQDAWDDLLDELKTQKDVTAVREAYEALLAEFPTAALYWKDFAEFEVGHGGNNAAKVVYSRCLLQCPNTDLWRSYLQLVRRVNEKRGAAGLGEVRQAFEYTLDRLGQDVGSGAIWQDYVAFLQAPRLGSPELAALFGGADASQEDSARMVALRRAFQKAILVPGPASDALWAAYEAFELAGANKALGRRAVDEWRPRWQAARALSTQRATLAGRLAHHALPAPPGRSRRPRVAAAALAAAREWLAWEASNPQALDPATLAARVGLAHDQALALHPAHPDLALAYAAWHARGSGGGGEAAALAVLDAARRAAGPPSLALHLAAAEAHERRGALNDARAVHEETVAGLGPDAAGAGESDNDTKGLGLDQAQGTLAWVQYLRFCARAESLTAARKAFLRARRWEGLRWQAFAASADLEWAAAGGVDTVPRKILELGLERHLAEPGYVLHYLAFLRGLGDVANARALLERALPAMPAERGRPLWDAYLVLEAEAGTLGTLRGVEERRRVALAALGPPRPASAEAVAEAGLKYGALGLLPVHPDAAASWRAALGERDGGDAAPAPSDADSSDEDGGVPPRGTRHGAFGGESAARTRGHDRASPAPRPASPSRATEGPRSLPRELQAFIRDLPPAHALDGPTPDVDQVLSVIMANDYSPAGIDAHEFAAARERRRQRAQREAEAYGNPAAPGFAAGPGGAVPAGMQPPAPKRKPDYGSDSGEEEGYGHTAGGAAGGAAGADVYRMRRKMARP